MGRRSLTVHEVTEILVHWQSGRSLKKIVRSLGVSRTVRKYVELARSLGFQQGEAELSASEWAAVLKEKAPGLFDAATRSREERRVPRVAFWAIDSERPIVRRMSVFGQDRLVSSHGSASPRVSQLVNDCQSHFAAGKEEPSAPEGRRLGLSVGQPWVRVDGRRVTGVACIGSA